MYVYVCVWGGVGKRGRRGNNSWDIMNERRGKTDRQMRKRKERRKGKREGKRWDRMGRESKSRTLFLPLATSQDKSISSTTNHVLAEMVSRQLSGMHAYFTLLCRNQLAQTISMIFPQIKMSTMHSTWK